MAYNLASPNGIAEPIALDDLRSWFAKELKQIPNPAEKRVLETVANDLDSFIQWAAEALLLWPECDRTPPPGRKQKYFSYPPHIREMAKTQCVVLDGRPNGPAIASFRLAGGKRPPRFGSSNSWSIHHLYSGKFPYPGYQETTHAAKSCLHFTQSAGLIAVHPIADAMVDEFPFFAWLLRGGAFLRFGYDPDGVFSSSRDDCGFIAGRVCRVIKAAPLEAAPDPGFAVTTEPVESETGKFAALKRDLQVGLDDLAAGRVSNAGEVFARLKRGLHR